MSYRKVFGISRAFNRGDPDFYVRIYGKTIRVIFK